MLAGVACTNQEKGFAQEKTRQNTLNANWPYLRDLCFLMVRLAAFAERRGATLATTPVQLAPLNLGVNQTPKTTVCVIEELTKQTSTDLTLVCKNGYKTYTLASET
jgi:hypothetical protein